MVFLSLIILLFIPLPILIEVKIVHKEFLLSIYKKRIDIVSNLKKKKDGKKMPSQVLKYFLTKLKNSKFKPWISLKVTLNFGFSDAAYTGIISGIIWCIYPIINAFIKIFFKLKKFEPNINPHFGENTFLFKTKCIIFLSLANIIYIVILFLESYIKSNNKKGNLKEVA